MGIRAGEKRKAVGVLIEFHKNPLQQLCLVHRAVWTCRSLNKILSHYLFVNFSLLFFFKDLIEENEVFLYKNLDIRQQLET